MGDSRKCPANLKHVEAILEVTSHGNFSLPASQPSHANLTTVTGAGTSRKRSYHTAIWTFTGHLYQRSSPRLSGTSCSVVSCLPRCGSHRMPLLRSTRPVVAAAAAICNPRLRPFASIAADRRTMIPSVNMDSCAKQ
jgi:hypothetical protein